MLGLVLGKDQRVQKELLGGYCCLYFFDFFLREWPLFFTTLGNLFFNLLQRGVDLQKEAFYHLVVFHKRINLVRIVQTLLIQLVFAFIIKLVDALFKILYLD
jgi:hypothetical protein